MGEAFVATIKGFRSDDENECTLTLRIPSEYKQQVKNVSDLTKQSLFVTVLTQADMDQKA